jgi:hypothetical protein
MPQNFEHLCLLKTPAVVRVRPNCRKGEIILVFRVLGRTLQEIPSKVHYCIWANAVD